jgi:glutamine amidotransferase
MISIIDYGMGNLRSVQKAFELYTADVQIITTTDQISNSNALILPGDGAFGMAMENLTSAGWVEAIYKYIESGNLFVGICVGFQLLFERSEEFGNFNGLGLISGDVIRFRDESLKVPHMGWNKVNYKKSSKYLEGIDDQSYFYFIHTYHPMTQEDVISGETDYGITFPSIVHKNNIFGTQFHPEKSHNAGLKIIENIVRDIC